MNTSILFFLAAFYTSCMSKNFTVIRSRHNSKYYILCVIDICTAENETDLEAVYFSHIFRTVVAQHNFSTVGYIMIEGCKSSCLYSDELLKLLNYDVINKVTAVVALYTASYISFFLDFVFNEFPQISVSKYIDCETSHLTLGGPAPINDILDVLERILISEGWYAFNIFYGPGTMYQDLANKLRSRNEKKWCVDVHFGIGKLQELNKMTYSNVSVILGDLLFLFPLMKELLKVNTVNVQFVMCCLQKDEFQEFMKLHEEMGRIFQNCIFIIMDPVNSSDYSDFLQMYAAQCQNVTSGNDSLPCTSWDKFESLDCEAEIFDYCNFLYENKISYFLQDSHLPDLTDPSKLISLLQRLITVLQHMNESHENMKQLRHFIQEFDFPPNLSWYSFSVIRIEKIDKEYQEVPFEISNEKTRENEGRVFCMRSCIPGEYMELDNLSRCCYSCKSCEPGTYSFGNGSL
ncbi:uncharacterized protein LOC122797803 [Protopterus annectens]|uniref:uncharacterized protein LOC122797803 n=1 Tax=Protopterus annectens TaxID=7888 RepID=UPI001CF9D764|nr:uncharacterized protein LOC122797803 [Protopterus annectens]